MADKKPADRIPTIDERVAELLEEAPPLTDEQNCRAARLWLAAKRSTEEAKRLTA